MRSTSARKPAHAPTKPNQDEKLTAWLHNQAGKLKRLKVKEGRLKLDFIANAEAQGRILRPAKERLANFPLRFKQWVENDTDIGYSTALLWIDLLDYPQVKARLADSNPLELTIRRIRDAIRDERQAQGKGKPGSGKKKAAARAENNHPFEGENVPQRVDKNSLSCVLRERWILQKAAPDCMPPRQSDEDFEEAHLCFQQAKNPGSTYATVAQATGKDEAEVERLLRGLDIDKVDALWAEFRRQAETPTTPQAETPTTPEQPFPQTVIHTGCKDFKIENDRTLSFADQHGDRIMVTTEKANLGRLLVKAVSSYQGKRGKGGSRATH